MSGSQAVRRALATAIVVCALYHAGAFLLLHLLAPAVNPVGGIITDYLNTPYRPLARSTFAAFGMMWAAVAAGLWRTLPRRRSLTTGVALMAFGATSLVLATALPEIADPRNADGPHRLLHRAASLGRLSLFASFPILSIALRWEPRFYSVGTVMLGIAIGSFVLLVVSLAALLEWGYAGVSQRLIFLLLYGWALLASYCIGRSAAGDAGRTG